MSQFTGGTMGNYAKIWLIITGVIMLVVGLGLAIGLGGVPYAGGAMLLTGGILALVGIGLIVGGFIVGRRAAATNQLLQAGTAGTAQITGLTQTGVYMNENPQIRMQLLVALPGQTPYAVQHTEIVPLMLLGRLSSGQPLAVRVDPMNLNRIAVDWGGSGFGMGGMAAGMAQMPAGMAQVPAAPTMPGTTAGSGQDESLAQVQAAMGGATGAAPMFSQPGQANLTVEQLRNYLRQSGLEAQARVDSMEDTGKSVGDESVYTMEMTLMIPGRQAQKLPKSAAMIPTEKKHRLFQGMTVPVKYEATNPNLLMVEWDKI